jgi:hypothetical protein
LRTGDHGAAGSGTVANLPFRNMQHARSHLRRQPQPKNLGAILSHN